MLKIRDSVDLKELEKFGFKPIYYGINNIIKYEYRHNAYDRSFWIDVDTRRVYLDECYSGDLIVLYDLIQAGLVEKVSD